MKIKYEVQRTMRLKELGEIVYCLNCGKPKLKLSADSGSLVCISCKQIYDVINGVPVFLQRNSSKILADTFIHKQHGTNFDYIDHYQKDGKVLDYFEERDAGVEHIDRRVHEYIFSQIRKKTGKVLDVGCGRAWVAQELCPKNYDVVSMDISLENTTGALERYQYSNHSAIVADVFSLPFNKNVFDIIIASEIIEHVVDPAGFVNNLMQVLKPGGELIVTTPYKEKIRYALCIHCNNPTPLFAHLHSFDEKKLTDLYTGSERKSCNTITFANKIPVHFRMHGFLKHFNFWLWKQTDRLFNFIYKAPLRILVKWEKEAG